MSPDPGVRCDIDGSVATITLTRPDRRNAQTPATWDALRAIGEGLLRSVRVVVVRGEGPSFSAGLDRAFLAGDASGQPTFLDLVAAPTAEAERRGGALPAGLLVAPPTRVHLRGRNPGPCCRGRVPARARV